jgi:hypothetical protein
MKLKLLSLFFVFSFWMAQAQIPTTGLIKDYKFTNGALTSDVVPALQAGTTTLVPTGSARTIINDRNAEVNKAISLNGDSFLAGGSNAATVNNYTISFWVKTTTNEATKRYIFDQHHTGTNPAGYSVSLKDGRIYFNGQSCWSSASVSNNSGIRQVISPVISDGQWHHVVCSLNSAPTISYVGSFTSYVVTFSYTMYVDNVSVPGDSVNVNFAMLTSESQFFRGITPTKQLVIGKSPDVAFLDYEEGIDQIRYYERTLNATEVGILYNEGPLTPIYVNANATGANNGSSWTDAYTSLDPAITAATLANEIWVAAGTYKPTGTGRTTTFNLKDGLKLYGGFNGTETLLSERNSATNSTVLSGDINGDDNATITASESTRQDNSYHVLTVRGNISSIVVDGFTISGGNANGPTLTTGTASAQYYHIRGGAIYLNTYAVNDNIYVVIKNCILEKNSATDTGVAACYYAGGVSFQSFRLDLDSCIIKNNYSGSNAQILIAGAKGFNFVGNSEIKNCLFHNNTSGSGPSCLYLSASTANGGNQYGINVDVINTTFSSNTGLNGNVIRTDNGSNSRFKNCIIYGNGSATPFNTTGTFLSPSVQSTISEGGQLSSTNSNPLLNTNFTLPAGSPAIDSGNNGLLVSGMTFDLNGNARIVGTNVDMGAYEYDVPLSIESPNSSSVFSVYPNPTNGLITIETDQEIKSVKLFSLDGKLLLEGQNSNLQIDNFPSGIYMLYLESVNGTTLYKKIIKN